MTSKAELRALAQQSSVPVKKLPASARSITEAEMRLRLYGEVDAEWRHERKRGEASGRYS